MPPSCPLFHLLEIMAPWWLVKKSTINMTLPNKAVKQKSNQIEFRICLLASPNQCVLSSLFSILIVKLNHVVPLCLSRQRHCQISSFSSDNWNLGETYWPFLLLLILIVSCLISPQQFSWLLLYLCLLINHWHTSPRCNLLRRAEKIAASLEQPGAYCWLTNNLELSWTQYFNAFASNQQRWSEYEKRSFF